jgi:branched-chain amino acid transport system substrate-binding protein
MLRGPSAKVVAALMALALLGSACSSRDDDDASTDSDSEEDAAAGESTIDTADCVSDPTVEVGDSIKLVSSYPQSGLTAAFSEVARGWKAYFDKVNAEGGVDFGGKTVTIEYEDADDQYNAAETAANIDEMVGPEGDGAFAVFSVIGTANNLAIRDTLGELCVPNVFAATGSPAWGNPDYPWTIGSTLSPYPLEAEIFAEIIEVQQPGAQVAMLVQDDDFGAAYEETLRAALEESESGAEVVQVEKYSTGASEVGAQITSLAASGADAFFNGGTLLACPDALTKAAAAGWQPALTWVSGTCTSDTLMGLAGEAANGVFSAGNLKDPLNPDWDADPAMVEYLETIRQYQPDGFRETNAIVAYGYTQAAVFVEALAAAEAPTRLALMEAMHSLDVSDVGLLLPGVVVATGPDDAYMGEALQPMQYEFIGQGQRNHFVPQGDVVDFEGTTTDITPEGLITG